MAEMSRPLAVMLFGHGAVRVDNLGGNQDRANRIVQMAELPLSDLEDRSEDELNRTAFGFTTGDDIHLPTRYFSKERVPFVDSAIPKALLRHDGSLVPLTERLARTVERESSLDVRCQAVVEADPVATIHLLAQEIRRLRSFDDDPDKWTAWNWDASPVLLRWDEEDPDSPVLLDRVTGTGWIDPGTHPGFYHVTTALSEVRASALKSRLQLLRETSPDFELPDKPYHRYGLYPKMGLGGSTMDRHPDTVSVTYDKGRALWLQRGIRLAVRCANAQCKQGSPVDVSEIVEFCLDLHGFSGGITAAVKAAGELQLARMYAKYLLWMEMWDEFPVPWLEDVRARIAKMPKRLQWAMTEAMELNLFHSGQLVRVDGELTFSLTAGEDIEGQREGYGVGPETAWSDGYVDFSDIGAWVRALLEMWSDDLESNEAVSSEMLARGAAHCDPEDLDQLGRDYGPYDVLQILDGWLSRLNGLSFECARIGFLVEPEKLAGHSPDEVGIVQLQLKAGAGAVDVMLEEWEITLRPEDVRLVPYAEIDRAVSGQRAWSRYEVAGFANTIVEQFGADPYAINNGLCEEFADALVNRLGPGAVTECAELDSPLAGHCWVRYLGRVYDSEAPTGVDYPWELPLYRRMSTPIEPATAWYGEV
jgi:hypothetical protein